MIWDQHPALLYGLALLLGCSLALAESFIVFFPVAILILLLVLNKSMQPLRVLLACAVMTGGYLHVHLSYQFPNESVVTGVAHVTISSVREKSSHGSKAWLYQGRIRSLIQDDGACVARNVPFRLYMKQGGRMQRPLANQEYIVKGSLTESAMGVYTLSVDKSEPWHPVVDTFSSAEGRWRVKEALGTYIRKHVHDNSSASFLVGIATGDFNDRLISYEFGRFGLQHIMAISGFHFAIIASFLHLFFRLVLPPRATAVVLIAILTMYFLFLGMGPAIIRSWVAISIALLALLFQRRAVALNSLGVGLMVTLLIDPLYCQHLGFQFSFLATAAILLLHSPIEKGLGAVLAIRPLSQTAEMDRFNQHAYLFLGMMRSALALTAAVHIVTLPLLLFYFHKLPLMSVVYNLFFPFLVSIAMMLLIAGSVCGLLIPFVGSWIHTLNDAYTQWILNFVFQTPASFDVYLRCQSLPAWAVVAWITLCLLAATTLRFSRDPLSQEKIDNAFI